MQVRVASHVRDWHDVALLMFAYQRETAVDLGREPPVSPEQTWEPLRPEVTDPASRFPTFLVAYDGPDPLGGAALVAHDALSVMLKRCYVFPAHRRGGVARALLASAADEAQQRGVARIVLDILASRQGAISAWQRLGFVECEPWTARSMRCFERHHPGGPTSSWLGRPQGGVAVHDRDRRSAKIFQHHAELLRRTLSVCEVKVEHSGSAAVAGRVAEPVVDVAVRLAAAADENVIRQLEGAGYVLQRNSGPDAGLLFVADDQSQSRIARVHVLGSE